MFKLIMNLRNNCYNVILSAKKNLFVQLLRFNKFLYVSVKKLLVVIK